MNESLRIACATDDGVRLTKNHFGDARYYLIYELDGINKTIGFIEKIKNLSPEEKMHGDPNKAASISEILKDSTVLLCCAMGKNVVRMRKRYCPVISKQLDIQKALVLLKEKYDEIILEANRELGEDRAIVYI